MTVFGVLNRCLLALAALLLSPIASAQLVTAFRINDMDLRDPHVFVNFLGCRDVTDTPLAGFSVNGELQTAIQTDENNDGFLDLSTLIEFLPLNQALATNALESGGAQCAAPLASTSCGAITSPGLVGDASLLNSGTCLLPLPGTPRPYAPAILSATGPCFTSPTGPLAIDLGGIPLTLQDARISAQFVGVPANNLVNGLIMGFVTEAAANATTVPPTVPFIGGQPLSSLLPGGTNNCAPLNDTDVYKGVRGWFFYLNFAAPRVPVNASSFVFRDGFE